MNARPDLLQVTSRGTRGGQAKTEIKGDCLITVTKGFNEPENYIYIDAYTGSGSTYTPRQTALLNIKLSNGVIWTGTFEQLSEKLK